MGRDWAELLRIALLCTALDWNTLDCYWLIWTWPTLDWNVLSWKGMNWNWTGTNRIGLDGRRFLRMDWTARQWSGPDWTEPDSASGDWTGRHALHWTWLSYSELDFIGLYYTALPWIELESTIQDSHCTSLDWSTPNCIRRIQMKLIKNVLLWLSFHEALQSCSTDLPALNSIFYYTILCSTFVRGRNPLQIAFKLLFRN